MGRDLPIMKETLSDQVLNPHLLRVYYFNRFRHLSPGTWIEKRHVRDYELEYFTYSKGGMVINETYYDIQKGDLAFKRPGDYTQAKMPYSCYLIGMDFKANTNRRFYQSKYEGRASFLPVYKHPILASLPSVFRPKHPQTYRILFEDLLQARLNPAPDSELKIKSLLMQLVLQYYQEVKDEAVIRSPYSKGFKQVVQYMKQHLDAPLTLEVLAHEMQLSPSHFHKVFKQQFGMTPMEYLAHQRLDKAKIMLVKEDKTIMDVALACGFNSATYFSTVFRKQMGLTPRQYRQEYNARHLN